MVQLIWC